MSYSSSSSYDELSDVCILLSSSRSIYLYPQMSYSSSSSYDELSVCILLSSSRSSYLYPQISYSSSSSYDELSDVCILLSSSRLCHACYELASPTCSTKCTSLGSENSLESLVQPLYVMLPVLTCPASCFSSPAIDLSSVDCYTVIMWGVQRN